MKTANTLKVGDSVRVLSSDNVELITGILTKKKGNVWHVEDGALSFSERIVASVMPQNVFDVRLTSKASDGF